MGSRKRGQRQPDDQPPRERPLLYHLDRFSAAEIRGWEDFKDRFSRFQWEYYQQLSYQRRRAADDLRRTLLEAAKGPFPFSKWQRVVRHRYSVEPLSLKGSVASDPGGRFNVGAIDPDTFPPFPALYAASDKDTALQEHLCQSLTEKSDLSPHEFALLSRASLTNVSISGRLDRIIDLGEPARLSEFVEVLAGFELSESLFREAKALRIEKPKVVRTISELMQAVLNKDWRIAPMNYDVPSQPQIFGSLVVEAGIEGIIYPSKFTQKECLAAFPHKFRGKDSFVVLDDEPPPQTVERRLDMESWKRLV